MIQLFLVLCGSRLIREKWWLLMLLGAVWVLFGGFLFLDALDGALWVPLFYFTFPLALGGLWALVSSFDAAGVGRTLRLAKAAVCLLVIGLILLAPQHSGVTIGILVGLLLCLNGIWRGFCAWVIRTDGWKGGLLFAVFEFLFGAWSFVPWPTAWEGEIGLDVGGLLFVTGLGMCFLALRIRRLPKGRSVLSILNPGETAFGFDAREPGQSARRETAIVHVWTPTEGMAPVHRGVSRYLAAVDKQGVISTGHAALELPPDVYISHYPAVEIDRSGAEFARVLRAVPDNNVPGLFQPNYAEESAGWSPSTARVELPGLNGEGIRRFWQEYRQDATYNLTSRNCAGAVVKALDAGLDGLFAVKISSPLFLLRLLLAPEFRVAGFMRRRAEAMTWTPGLALDYAHSLRHLVDLL